MIVSFLYLLSQVIIYSLLLLLIYDNLKVVHTYFNVNFNPLYRKYITKTNNLTHLNSTNDNNISTKLKHTSIVYRNMLPTRITLYHCFMFLTVVLNWYIQGILAIFYTIQLNILHYCFNYRQTISSNNVGQLLMNTTLALYAKLTPITDNNGNNTDKEFLHWEIDSFAFPEIPNKFDNTLVIEATIQLKSTTNNNNNNNNTNINDLYDTKIYDTFNFDIHKFELNGVSITNAIEQMTILSTMLATVVHPITHSYFDQIYNYNYYSMKPEHIILRHQLEYDYSDLLLHGQYVNYVSWTASGYLFGDRKHFKSCTIHNSSKLNIPLHEIKNLHNIAKYSASFKFFIESHKVLFHLVHKYKVPMDCELLFLSMIEHAVNHYVAYSIQHNHYQHITYETAKLLHSKSLTNSWFNMLCKLFYSPSHHVAANTLKNKRHKTLFYNELYSELSALNKSYADQVCLSICY